ncbi:hypothetical protein KCP76_17975 [Salmonella enterica subsp. enterica serovar Weltevreden]|nr:hypothetical protein KCP76_17975 [Salmonella enterica subsp. enterica serovar Weltevreden]
MGQITLAPALASHARHFALSLNRRKRAVAHVSYCAGDDGFTVVDVTCGSSGFTAQSALLAGAFSRKR